MTPAGGKRIGLFGGAFDPVHIGHIKVAQSFLDTRLMDRLLILPTAESPHKETSGQVSFHHRFKMLQLAFLDEDDVEISDLEQHLPKPSYTLQTIEHLQENFPDNHYFLCIGEDNLDSFQEWWNYETILEKVTLIVAKRPAIEGMDGSEKILNHVIFAEHDEIDISSTEIRRAKLSGELSQYVPAGVDDYIRRHKLYSR